MHLTATLKVPMSSRLTPTELNALKDLWTSSFWDAFVASVEAVKAEFPQAKDIWTVVIPKLALVNLAMDLGHPEAAKPIALTLVKRGALHLTTAKTIKLR